MIAPYLTRARWEWLTALKQSRTLQSRPFLAHELKYEWRSEYSGERKTRAATGATMASFEKAGWVERTTWGVPGQGMPFQCGGPINAWRITDAGRMAIELCPDTFPGDPVYRKGAA